MRLLVGVDYKILIFSMDNQASRLGIYQLSSLNVNRAGLEERFELPRSYIK